MHDQTHTFHIDALIRLADGSRCHHTEAHRLPMQDADGSWIVAYNDEFAHERAAEVAEELGGSVEEVETFTVWPNEAYIDFHELDNARD